MRYYISKTIGEAIGSFSSIDKEIKHCIIIIIVVVVVVVVIVVVVVVVVRTIFSSLAQKVDGFRPKKPKTMNL